MIEWQVGGGVIRIYGEMDIEVERTTMTTRVRIGVRAPAGHKPDPGPSARG